VEAVRWPVNDAHPKQRVGRAVLNGFPGHASVSGLSRIELRKIILELIA
jgi:hypothetical protein